MSKNKKVFIKIRFKKPIEWVELIPIFAESIKESDSESLQLAIEALNKIAFPIEYLQKEAEKAGGQLNGHTVMQLIKDSSFYQDIAKEVLKKI